MANQDEEVIVILENEMVGGMLEIGVKLYGKYVINGKNGSKYMYVYLRKAMYGMMNA